MINHNKLKWHNIKMQCIKAGCPNIQVQPGRSLSDVLKVIAECGANILTIHQSIPINGVAALSISIQVLETTKNVSEMLTCMEQLVSVHHVKVLARE